MGKIQIHAGGRGKSGGVQELKNDEDLNVFNLVQHRIIENKTFN